MTSCKFTFTVTDRQGYSSSSNSGITRNRGHRELRDMQNILFKKYVKMCSMDVANNAYNRTLTLLKQMIDRK